jgi:hypothetical protein
MANATVSRLGQIEGANSVTATFLEMFSGLVLKFRNNKAMADKLVFKKTISEGITFQFPVIGKTVAGYHTPGTEIVGSAIHHNEKILTVDGVHLSSVFVAEWDQLLNHYDVMSEYAKQLGEALAIEKDELILRSAFLSASNATPLVTGFPVGAVATLGAGLTSAAATGFSTAFSAKLFAAAQQFAEKNWEASEVTCVTTPAVFYALAQDTDLYNKDFASGGGDFTEGLISKVGGIKIIKHNNFPTTNRAADDALQNNVYISDMSKACALIFAPMAVGLLERKGVTVERTYDPRRLGTLVTAREVWGAAGLRNDAAYAIKFAAA